jgi:hypothetical protein
LATPFDLDSIDLLVRLGLNIFKIPSGEITNLPYLRNFVLAGCCLPGATNDEDKDLTLHTPHFIIDGSAFLYYGFHP